MAQTITTAAGFVLIATGCTDKATTQGCYDPEQLSNAQMNLRASLNYTDLSTSTSACRGCSYFTQGSQTADCGNCAIFNGSVSAKGHCSSWSPKA
ncbi:hypothetical protein G8770_16250 [Aestuariicella hydrocarbonica]|uniref:High-potential iron-sulfur protein n=1 Tax=Pseudomaricurvus hydrocarbonicus TaxID=1470433 RepID=A0A9E5MMT1_9GAMM|nr:high-potential iron-sulfur protein [Aestuariicella hydrocarbonica]NHO67100.1 hypothetical protein [Aestuariicella hydrocarbonica]